MSIQGTADRTENARIWDGLYESGNFMWYPSEILVKLLCSLEGGALLRGTVLDHGAGSGNCAEFLVRKGNQVLCTDPSRSALEVIRQRFVASKLHPPRLLQVDVGLSLKGQLPPFDHAIAWQSLSYNRRANLLKQMEELIELLPRGGYFVVCLPTVNDFQGKNSIPCDDGSRILQVDGQHGATITLPESVDELVSWCDGLQVVDALTHSIRAKDSCTEEAVVMGIKR